REDAHTMRDHMIRVGVDAAAAFTTSVDGLTLEPVPTVQADELQSRIEAGEVGAEQDTVLVDVRNKTEFSHGTVADARQLNAGKVLFHQ
ncbi:MBL fold metallo-hydrolase, partial [Xanthomonas citri pv. citri]|nr:MBL fold metallo-hydrolase [Xanthomonas citri pv. citri]